MSSSDPSLNRAVEAEVAEHESKDVATAVNVRKRTRDEMSDNETELDQTVTDVEVEEFCAILRRLRRPVKYFGGIERLKRWRPSFVAEDFNGVEEVATVMVEKENGAGSCVEGFGIQKQLDLNVNPLTE